MVRAAPERAGRIRLALGLAILLAAAFARLWALGDVPPGLQHDEIFKAEEGRLLAEYGDFRLFYPSNQGHEGLYVWMLAVSHMLFGTSTLMIKFPAFACGLLTVALLYRVVAETYGLTAGAVAGGLGAVSFWAVFTSRVGLRAVTLPIAVLLVLWGLARLCQDAPGQAPRWRIASLTGAALGVSIYTYTSSLALFAAYGAFVAWLALVDRAALRQRWRELAAIALIGAALAAPMVAIRLTNPQGLNRASTITRPWEDFKQGKPGELLDNARGLVGMLAFTGDPEARYNVPGRPLFVIPVGLLGYVGLGLAGLRGRRAPLNAAWVALALFGLVPSLVTVSAPSYLRSIVVMPSMLAFIGIAVAWSARRIGRDRAAGVSLLLGSAVVGVTAAVDLPAYFGTWARLDEVQAIYRGDLAALADHLRGVDESVVFVSTPDQELDPLLYRYSNPPGEPRVVFFDAFANIVLREEPALLFVSPLSPISPAHAEWLTPEMGTARLEPLRRSDGGVAFEVYRVSAEGAALVERLAAVSERPVFTPGEGAVSPDLDMMADPVALPVTFGGVVRLAGFEVPRERVTGVNDGVNLQLYLQPLASEVDQPLNVFVHLLAADGRIVAQRDLMGVAPPMWQAGNTIVQDNFVPFWEPVPPGRYVLSMGVYDWRTGARLPAAAADGTPLGDHILLGAVEVTAPEGE